MRTMAIPITSTMRVSSPPPAPLPPPAPPPSVAASSVLEGAVVGDDVSAEAGEGLPVPDADDGTGACVVESVGVEKVADGALPSTAEGCDVVPAPNGARVDVVGVPLPVPDGALVDDDGALVGGVGGALVESVGARVVVIAGLVVGAAVGVKSEGSVKQTL